MTLACVRRPTCEARPAARKASDITYTPPWKYRTTWRGSIPSTVISAVGTPPSAVAIADWGDWRVVRNIRGAGSASRCCHGVLLRLRDYSSNLTRYAVSGHRLIQAIARGGHPRRITAVSRIPGIGRLQEVTKRHPAG